MYRLKSVLLAVVAIGFLAGCGSSEVEQPQLPAYTNPLLENGDGLPGTHWNDPHVLQIDDQFVMYASADIDWDGFVRIYRLTSTDGFAWNLSPTTPVFEKSATGWDSHGTETPAVVFFQGQYHLFYTGYDVTYDYTAIGADNIWGTFDDDSAIKHFKIGHAVSNDGVTFTRQPFVVEPTDPYAVPNLDFHQSVVGEPAPVVFNNKLYLYFTAIGAHAEVNSTWQVIGLMTSADGATWDTPRPVLKPDLTVYPRDQYIGYSTPNAVALGGALHLYFDVALDAPWTQAKLHHAVSNDGESNWIQDRAPLLGREDYSWTTAEIRSPSALVQGNQMYLYFAGHVMTPEINLAIGLEILPLP